MKDKASKAITKAMEYHYFNSTSPSRYHAMISISNRLRSGKLSENQVKYWATK